MPELWLEEDWGPICDKCLADKHGECPDLIWVIENGIDYGMMACSCEVQGVHPHE